MSIRYALNKTVQETCGPDIIGEIIEFLEDEKNLRHDKTGQFQDGYYDLYEIYSLQRMPLYRAEVLYVSLDFLYEILKNFSYADGFKVENSKVPELIEELKAIQNAVN